jgi:hypothetical protein
MVGVSNSNQCKKPEIPKDERVLADTSVRSDVLVWCLLLTKTYKGFETMGCNSIQRRSTKRLYPFFLSDTNRDHMDHGPYHLALGRYRFIKDSAPAVQVRHFLSASAALYSLRASLDYWLSLVSCRAL